MSAANPFRRPAQRQYPLVAEAFVDWYDLLEGGPVLTSATDTPGVEDVGDLNSDAVAAGTGSSLDNTAFNLFELPAGAIVIGGDIKVLTAFNSATTDVLSIGDSGSATRYASAVDLKTAARTALTVPARQTTATEKVIAKWNGTGTAPTAGRFHVTLEYIIADRVNETQGT